MKHLVSLALRYLRRQRLRTLLTFMCITLSVFLICSVAAYLSSGINTLRNNEALETGTWEVDMSGIVNDSDDPIGTIHTIRDHVAVSDYFSGHNEYYGNYMYDDIDDIDQLRITFDGHTESVDVLGANSYNGNKLIYDFDYLAAQFYDDYVGLNGQNDASLAYLPAWLRDEYGYKEGDRIKFTFTPIHAKVDTDDEGVRSVIDASGVDLTEYDGEKSDEKKYRLMGALYKNYKLADIPLKNISVGAAYTAELKIAGFYDDDWTYYLDTNSQLSRRLMDIYVPENSVLDLSEIARLNPGVEFESSSLCFIRTNDALDFDDAMNKLVHDLGYDEDYDIVLDNYEGIAGVAVHDALLRWEFKRAGNIAQYIGFIVFLLIMIVIAWLLSRFIIDNAFNISVQERSVQFATLRIMGASKAQITALVLTEAMFYTVTAVPIGALSAFAICRYVFDTLGSLGDMGFEYVLMKPFAFTGIGLCILAVFISALTSALWASRRLSPAEAMNYGRPKLRERDYKRKSKLGRSPVSFLMNYTKRNLRTHISQNVVSTVSLALGVMMFLTCMFVGLLIKNDRERMIFDKYDFSIQLTNDKAREDAHETFDDSSLFKDVSYEGECVVICEDGELEYGVDFYSISREDYEKYAEADTGVSYDEFRDSHYALCSESDSPYAPDIYKGAVSDVSDMDKNFSFHIIGSLNSEMFSGTGVYAAEESFYSEVVPASSSYYYLTVYMKVSGAEKYHEAYMAANKFVAEHGAFLGDSYINCTGFSSFIRALVTMGGSFIFSVWLAGVFAMISVVNTSVLNRKRELAMMRAVGMTKRQLYGTVIYESVRFSAVSTVIGVVLGIALSALGTWLIRRGELSDIFSFIALSVLLTVILNTAVAAAASIPALSSLKKDLKAER